MEKLSEEATQLYFRLFGRILPFKGWPSLTRVLFPRLQLKRPVPARVLKAAESKIGMPIPENLKSFYRFADGLTYYERDLIYSVESMVEGNLLMRGYKRNMPMDHLLCFGGTGDGDEFAFDRRVDGEYHSTVFVWRHETDERAEYEGNLPSYLLRRSVDFKTQPHLRRVG